MSSALLFACSIGVVLSFLITLYLERVVDGRSGWKAALGAAGLSLLSGGIVFGFLLLLQWMRT